MVGHGGCGDACSQLDTLAQRAAMSLLETGAVVSDPRMLRFGSLLDLVGLGRLLAAAATASQPQAVLDLMHAVIVSSLLKACGAFASTLVQGEPPLTLETPGLALNVALLPRAPTHRAPYVWDSLTVGGLKESESAAAALPLLLVRLATRLTADGSVAMPNPSLLSDFTTEVAPCTPPPPPQAQRRSRRA